MGWIQLNDDDPRLVVGDEPWDIMSEALSKINKAYQKEWHREVTYTELEDVFNFVARARYKDEL